MFFGTEQRVSSPPAIIEGLGPKCIADAQTAQKTRLSASVVSFPFLDSVRFWCWANLGLLGAIVPSPRATPLPQISFREDHFGQWDAGSITLVTKLQLYNETTEITRKQATYKY